MTWGAADSGVPATAAFWLAVVDIPDAVGEGITGARHNYRERQRAGVETARASLGITSKYAPEWHRSVRV